MTGTGHTKKKLKQHGVMIKDKLAYGDLSVLPPHVERVARRILDFSDSLHIEWQDKIEQDENRTTHRPNTRQLSRLTRPPDNAYSRSHNSGNASPNGLAKSSNPRSRSAVGSDAASEKSSDCNQSDACRQPPVEAFFGDHNPSDTSLEQARQHGTNEVRVCQGIAKDFRDYGKQLKDDVTDRYRFGIFRAPEQLYQRLPEWSKTAWSIHRNVLWTEDFRCFDKGPVIPASKPDLFYGLRIVRALNDSSIPKHGRMIDNIKLNFLLRLKKHLKIQSTVTNKLGKLCEIDESALGDELVTTDSQHLTCFPFAVVEFKRHKILDADIEACQCQAAQASRRVLWQLNRIFSHAYGPRANATPNSRSIMDRLPPIVAFTCVGSMAHVWVTYEDKGDSVTMRCIYQANVETTWGVMSLRRIVKNMLEWSQDNFAQNIHPALDNLRDQLPEQCSPKSDTRSAQSSPIFKTPEASRIQETTRVQAVERGVSNLSIAPRQAANKQPDEHAETDSESWMTAPNTPKRRPSFIPISRKSSGMSLSSEHATNAYGSPPQKKRNAAQSQTLRYPSLPSQAAFQAIYPSTTWENIADIPRTHSPVCETEKAVEGWNTQPSRSDNPGKSSALRNTGPRKGDRARIGAAQASPQGNGPDKSSAKMITQSRKEQDVRNACVDLPNHNSPKSDEETPQAKRSSQRRTRTPLRYGQEQG